MKSTRWVASWAEDLLTNSGDVIDAITHQRSVPSLRLRNGITVYHESEDLVLETLYEIFYRKVYTGGGFYFPRPGDTIFDCGANIGLFALYLCSLERRLRIVCFEPCAKTLKMLDKNITINELSETVEVFPCALYGHDCVMTLEAAPASVHRSLRRNRKTVPSDHLETVQCLSLESAIRACGSPCLSLLKMDVQGAECAVLQGVSASFDWNSIKKISLEVHEYIQPQCSTEIEGLLKQQGYTIIDSHDGTSDLGIVRAIRSKEDAKFSS